MTTLTRPPIPPLPPKPARAPFPWRNQSLWETWRDRVIDGVSVSFAHLWPFDMLLTRPARENLPAMRVEIRVVFDCHVCTEAYAADRHAIVDGADQLWVDAGRSVRVFDALRYRLSHQLPDMIRGLIEGKTKCYGAGRHNYMLWKPMSGKQAHASQYQVFFDLYRTSEPHPRLVMYIQSAFLKTRPNVTQRKNVLVFATLCAQTMGLIRSGRKIQSP